MYWQRPMAVYVHTSVRGCAAVWLIGASSIERNAIRFSKVFIALCSRCSPSGRVEKGSERRRRRRRRKERFNKNRAEEMLNILSLPLSLSVERERKRSHFIAGWLHRTLESVRPFSVGSHLSFVPITSRKNSVCHGAENRMRVYQLSSLLGKQLEKRLAWLLLRKTMSLHFSRRALRVSAMARNVSLA